MKLADLQYLFAYIKATNGIVVVTRSILMELCASDGNLWTEHVEYFRRMYQDGIPVLVIFEEDLFDVLSLYTTSTELVNRFLSMAVKHVKRQTGVVSQILDEDAGLRRQLLSSEACADRSLFRRFFSRVRECKSSGDNLGEELVLVGLHMLANIPEEAPHKYIFFTDDKEAVGITGTVKENIRRHRGLDYITAFTTPRLAQQLWDERIFTQKEQIVEMLLPGSEISLVRVLCSQEYELKLAECVFTADDLADHIVNGSGFRVFI